MRLSRYFLPLLKETPSDATIASHRYMLRAAMVKQDSAGIYILSLIHISEPTRPY